MSDQFGFDLEDKATRDAVKSLALEHCFDPVADMLDKAEAEWDGVERLDRMAADYFNCEDTPLNRACVRKTMIAAVARVRQPGVKFDTIPVLEARRASTKARHGECWQVTKISPTRQSSARTAARCRSISPTDLDSRERRTGRDEEGRGGDRQGVREPTG